MKREFLVTFPTDNGFFGRQCNSNECNKYFKVNSDQIVDQMHCPYCGELFQNDELWTDEQSNHVREVATQEVNKHAINLLDEMLGKMARQSRNITIKKGRRKQFIKPTPSEEKQVDKEIKCPQCSTEFQVYGIFGYCPCCGEENLMIYDANMKLIIDEINNAQNSNRALRHAYKDLVSTFEFYCKSAANKLELGSTNFQEIKGTRKLFKNSPYQIDIYQSISAEEKTSIKRVFQKRHLYEHNNGVISERYIKEIPEDSNLLGEFAELSMEEFQKGSQILRILLEPIVERIARNK